MYRRAIDLQPTHIAALNNYVDMLLESGCNEQAIPLYKTTLLLEADSIVSLHGLGMALRAIGHLELAMKVYGKMLAHLPDSAVAHNNVGSIQQSPGTDRRGHAKLPARAGTRTTLCQRPLQPGHLPDEPGALR